MTTTLYMREGTADKVYTVTIKPEGSGFTVVATWGRRGGHMTQAVKAKCEPWSDAKRTYDRLVIEKCSKGYTIGADAAPVTTPAPLPADAPKSALAFVPPMLLSEIDPFTAERLIDSGDWCSQMKFDGIRCQLHRTADGVKSYSRTGKPVALPKAVIDDMMGLEPVDLDLILDGEMVEGIFIAFDILRLGGGCQHQPLSFRLALLRSVIEDNGDGIWNGAFDTASDPAQKRKMLEKLRELGAEGIVFKRLDAPYTSGRPNSGGDGFKLKFVATASVIVSKVNAKRSVDMKLADGTEIGSVTIPPNKAVPAVGDVIEVRYLYAFREGSLIQAVYLMKRDDIDPSACVASQLQYKNEPKKPVGSEGGPDRKEGVA